MNCTRKRGMRLGMCSSKPKINWWRRSEVRPVMAPRSQKLGLSFLRRSRRGLRRDRDLRQRSGPARRNKMGQGQMRQRRPLRGGGGVSLSWKARERGRIQRGRSVARLPAAKGPSPKAKVQTRVLRVERSGGLGAEVAAPARACPVAAVEAWAAGWAATAIPCALVLGPPPQPQVDPLLPRDLALVARRSGIPQTRPKRLGPRSRGRFGALPQMRPRPREGHRSATCKGPIISWKRSRSWSRRSTLTSRCVRSMRPGRPS
mmetsp:Transcript_87949/g.188659  ORF Transcript_87949/g.188659 Transcript_87949/m.188659 type:complete len:260 (-) Transcript_87949:594-1373(-)